MRNTIKKGVVGLRLESFLVLWQKSHTTLPFSELLTHCIYNIRLSRHTTPSGWLTDKAAAAVAAAEMAVAETATAEKLAPGGTKEAASKETGAAAGAAAAVETATAAKEYYRAGAADIYRATSDLETAVADRNRRSLSAAAENDDVILRGEFLRTEAGERFYFPSQALPKEDDLRLVDNLGNNEDIEDINRDGSSLAGAKEKHFLLDAQPLLDRKVTASTKIVILYFSVKKNLLAS
jgi:hypothetical protein